MGGLIGLENRGKGRWCFGVGSVVGSYRRKCSLYHAQLDSDGSLRDKVQ
jgi:hypothetical protein